MLLHLTSNYSLRLFEFAVSHIYLFSVTIFLFYCWFLQQDIFYAFALCCICTRSHVAWPRFAFNFSCFARWFGFLYCFFSFCFLWLFFCAIFSGQHLFWSLRFLCLSFWPQCWPLSWWQCENKSVHNWKALAAPFSFRFYMRAELSVVFCCVSISII